MSSEHTHVRAQGVSDPFAYALKAFFRKSEARCVPKLRCGVSHLMVKVELSH